MRHLVELRGVSRTFPGPPAVQALRPVDLVVSAGESVAITGPSGSGKSTLLHLLGLLDRSSSGSYLLDGSDTGALSDAERTRLRGRRIGFVFQGFYLVSHRSALENVMLALVYRDTPRRRRRAMALQALERVRLAHRAHAMPNTLSGGERQRVAIARALVTRPAVLLADEPTGNLDSITAEEVLTHFEELHQDGQATIVVTHDREVASRASRQLHIRDGLLADLGTGGSDAA